MRIASKLLAVALTATLQSAMAGTTPTIPLDFEDLTATAKLTGNYNGVTISGDAWGVVSQAAGCNGDFNFVRAGSCGGLWIAFDPENNATTDRRTVTMTIADGFDGLSFVYSGAITVPQFSVHVFDATGKELGKGLDNRPGAGCQGFLFCNWSLPIDLAFTGTASYVEFTAIDQSIMIDDLKFKKPTSTGRLPEPASLALVAGALGVMGWSRKRKAAR